MWRRSWHMRWAVSLSMAVVLSVSGAMGIGGVAGTAVAGDHEADRPPDRVVNRWVQRQAEPLSSTSPGAPAAELAPLGAAVGEAHIVGLGEAVHGSADTTALKHRTLRYLVQEKGFRSIAWEDDWTLGIQINRYVLTGAGDLRDLVADMSTAWESREVTAILRWLRHYNVVHPGDPVQFVGTEAYATRPLAYEAIEAHVRRTAPARLEEAQAHLDPLTPPSDDMGAYVAWYWQCVTDKAPYVEHARQLFDVVKSLPGSDDAGRDAIVEHHARQIVGFYEQFAASNVFAYRDTHAAKNLRWWHEFTGDRIVYWAATGHTAAAPEVRLIQPPYPDLEFTSVGSYLRDWYRHRYHSIAFTVDRGSVISEGRRVAMPPAADDWFEAPLRTVRAENFILDLPDRAPRPIRDWLHEPIKTRGIPEGGHDSFLTGGTAADWFDTVVHSQDVSPVHPLIEADDDQTQVSPPDSCEYPE